MSFCRCRSHSKCRNSCGPDTSFVRHMHRFTGETVTIFTTSGGPSGCGFTGVILSVNCFFVRLVTEFGEAPSNPLAANICPGIDQDSEPCGPRITSWKDDCHGRDHHSRAVGSVVDIPVNTIAAFCHNAI